MVYGKSSRGAVRLFFCSSILGSSNIHLFSTGRLLTLPYLNRGQKLPTLPYLNKLPTSSPCVEEVGNLPTSSPCVVYRGAKVTHLAIS